MISLNIKTDFKEVSAMLDDVGKRIEARAVPPALNAVASGAKTEMVRAITSSYVITASEIRPRIRFNRASKRLGIYEASIDPFAGGRKGQSMNLIRFLEKKVTIAEMRRRRKRGEHKQLRFKIRRDNGLQTIPGAFIGNNGRTIFRRVGASRYPIEAVQTRDIPGMFNTRRISARVLSRIRQDLPKEIIRAVKAVLYRRIK